MNKSFIIFIEELQKFVGVDWLENVKLVDDYEGAIILDTEHEAALFLRGLQIGSLYQMKEKLKNAKIISL